MDRPPTRRTAASASVLAVAILISALARPGAAAEPTSGAEAWRRLEAARDRLAETGPLVADFVQTYVPAGFDQGERESGRVALALPDCLRWDYEIPYPKAFLLCDERVFSWNPGEASGRRYRIDPEEEPGLDLLRLGVESLRVRYRAEVASEEDGRVTVRLVPSTPTGALAEATLTLVGPDGRPGELAYLDAEGNRTRFELASYRPASEPGLFAPPDDIAWDD